MNDLLDKFLNDEISEEEFSTEFAKLSPEEQGAMESRAKDEKGKTFVELKALRKEKNRVSERTVTPETTPPAAEPAKDPRIDQVREENLVEAKSQFFEFFSIDEAERAKYDDFFKSADNGAISVKSIFEGFKKTYASEHADELIGALRRQKDLENGAEDFISFSAGPTGTGGPGTGDEKKYSPEAYELVKKARKEGTELSLDAAENYLKRGAGRIYS